jgi:hypothetical protein
MLYFLGKIPRYVLCRTLDGLQIGPGRFREEKNLFGNRKNVGEIKYWVVILLGPLLMLQSQSVIQLLYTLTFCLK